MKNTHFFEAIDALCVERELDKESVLAAVEKGIINAYKKEKGIENARVVFNEEKQEYYIADVYDVVANDQQLDPEQPSQIHLSDARLIKKTCKVGEHFEVKEKIDPRDFGRIAINSTKQILSQEIKRLEREKAYKYFVDHVGEMITGKVTSYDEYQVYFDLGYQMSGSVPLQELPRDEIRTGAKVPLYLSKVEMTSKGPKAYVSRSDKNLIKRLFETNIPEIAEGTIDILGVARDPGDRTKVCVKSNDPNVDALGSCLGVKGKRIKAICDALGGEKIEVFEYDTDIKKFITNALTPAEVIGVMYDEHEKQALAIVPDDQFSLAIGKKGQNVRLSVLASGWKIDIKNVTEALEKGYDF